MPISIGEFRKGKKTDSFEEGVLSFLEQNKDKAFTVIEIALGVGMDAPSCASLLNRLEREGRIIKKRINLVEYYSSP